MSSTNCIDCHYVYDCEKTELYYGGCSLAVIPPVPKGISFNVINCPYFKMGEVNGLRENER